MPYIIITTEGREAYEQRRAADPGAYRSQGVTCRAVATLDEAIEDVEQAALTFSDVTITLPEAGGTVGPLLDGTVIVVERVSWDEMTAAIGWAHEAARWPANVPKIVDAYNAQQA
jgi:hypothetical protein